jgi:hypothetical protein
MSMHCYICKKKLNIFSDYTQTEIDGVKREICTPCFRKREEEEVKQLLQTTEGKKNVSLRGSTLISTGVLEIGIGIYLIWFLHSIWFVILVGFGVYSLYKGVSYKNKARKK